MRIHTVDTCARIDNRETEKNQRESERKRRKQIPTDEKKYSAVDVNVGGGPYESFASTVFLL